MGPQPVLYLGAWSVASPSLLIVISNEYHYSINYTCYYYDVIGLLCDLLWADPDKETVGWGDNDRGVSFTFGPEIVSKFLCKHDLDLICRAHQVRIYCIVWLL